MARSWMLRALVAGVGGVLVYIAASLILRAALGWPKSHFTFQLGGADQLLRGDQPRGDEPPPDYPAWQFLRLAIPDVFVDFLLILGYGIALYYGACLSRALFRSAESQKLARAVLPLSLVAVTADVLENAAFLLAVGLEVLPLMHLVTAASVVKWVCLVLTMPIAVTALSVSWWRLRSHSADRLRERKRRSPVHVLPPDPLDGDPPAPQADEVPGTGQEGEADADLVRPTGIGAPMEATRWRKGFAVPDLSRPTSALTQTSLRRRGPVSGFCLSGGGIRSGSVALGALQALRPELVRAQYLVSVSGGGYTAGALQMALTPKKPPTLEKGDTIHRNPVDAYGPGSAEEDRFRRHVRYLAGSPAEIVVALGVVARGLVLSLLVLFTPAVLVGALVGLFYREVPLARRPGAVFGKPPTVPEGTWWAIGVTAGAAALVFLVALWLGVRRGRPRRGRQRIRRALRRGLRRLFDLQARPERLPGERARELGSALSTLSLVVAIAAVGVPWLLYLAGSVLDAARAADAPALEVGGPVLGVLLTYAMALVSLVRRKKVVERAGGLFRRKDAAGKTTSAVAAVPGGALQLLLVVVTVVLLSAAWLFLLAGFAAEAMRRDEWDAFWIILGFVALGLAGLGGVLDQTALSLHPFYRRRLAHAFAARRLIRHSDNKVVAEPYRYDEMTSLPEYAAPVKGFPEVVFAAAANLTGEQRAPLDAASFTFTSTWIGGPDVGYVRASQVSAAVGPAFQRDLTVQAAVAVSGAAFASAMGRAGRWYGTLLAISGLRLGTWLPNPAFLAEWNDVGHDFEKWTGPGLPSIRRFTYLFREVLGSHRYGDRLLQITDGGHYENLGLVEALRRRCSLVYCVDASGDRPPTAGTLEQAITLAWHELGVRIVLPDDIWKLVPGSAEPLDPEEPLSAVNGRLSASNVATAMVCYPEASDLPKEWRHGLLVLGKALITRDMSYDLLSYAARSEIFPHDSTGDQFFKDEMFTAYAGLGRHTGIAMRDAVAEARETLSERCPACGSESARDEVIAALRRMRPDDQDGERSTTPWERIRTALW